MYWDYCRYMGYPMAAFVLGALLVGQAASLGSECALPVSWHPRSLVYARFLTGLCTIWLEEMHLIILTISVLVSDGGLALWLYMRFIHVMMTC